MANGLDRYAVFSEDGDRLLAIGKTWRRRCSARRVNAAARSAPVADKRAAVERARKEAEAKRIEEDAAARGSELDRGTVVELRL